MVQFFVVVAFTDSIFKHSIVFISSGVHNCKEGGETSGEDEKHLRRVYQDV